MIQLATKCVNNLPPCYLIIRINLLHNNITNIEIKQKNVVIFLCIEEF